MISPGKIEQTWKLISGRCKWIFNLLGKWVFTTVLNNLSFNFSIFFSFSIFTLFYSWYPGDQIIHPARSHLLLLHEWSFCPLFWLLVWSDLLTIQYLYWSLQFWYKECRLSHSRHTSVSCLPPTTSENSRVIRINQWNLWSVIYSIIHNLLKCTNLHNLVF